MAGIYIHIPFCKQACHYCNFHFSTSLRAKPAMLEALVQELYLQRNYLDGKPLSSIYLGGGTPSLLDTADLVLLFNAIRQFHSIQPDAEITIEANPDDLTAQKLESWKNQTPINRLSIGIQSFHEEDLRWMNRAHNATEARESIDRALKAGFNNLTIDLIYGAPTTSDQIWEKNVQTALDYGIPHLSCYCLTVEERTALGVFVKKGKEPPVDEEKSARQFEYLMQAMDDAGYVHYEISNFALPGHFAHHNSSYWKGDTYLGIGPSAHSFNGVSRQWNLANNASYIRSLQEGIVPFEMEVLTPVQQYNEYIMTGMRTVWGCALSQIRNIGAPFEIHFRKAILPFLDNGTVVFENGTYRLSRSGRLLADGIALDLFHPA
jgi:oxygen-independent coproporphyrinogen-3 oxidase